MSKLGKKGISVWISWVLLIAFVVALSAFMYRFIAEYSEDKTDAMREVVANLDQCKQVSLSMRDACQNASLTQDLYINIENTNSRRIDKVQVRALDTSRVPLGSQDIEFPMNPDRLKELQVSFNTSTNVSYIQVIPVVYDEEFEIICSEKEAVAQDIPAC